MNKFKNAKENAAKVGKTVVSKIGDVATSVRTKFQKNE